MRFLILCVTFIALFALPVHAAYNTATILTNEALPNGQVRLSVKFTGNAGEPPITRDLVINGNMTASALKQWAYDQVNDLNGTRTFATAAGLQPGQSVTIQAITPPTPPTPTAKEVWREKVSRYQRLSIVGLSGAAATDLAALLGDINTTYQAGFLQ
jgi:hypothetical protein